MHEMGIALEIIDIVKKSIPTDLKSQPVCRVRMQVGKLSSVVTESLKFCFEAVTRDDPVMKSAVLDVEEIPITAKCQTCGHQWTIEAPVFMCQRCNSGSINILSGRELDIESIEVAD